MRHSNFTIAVPDQVSYFTRIPLEVLKVPLNNKRIDVYYYLSFNKLRNDEIFYSLYDMVSFSGFSINTRNKKENSTLYNFQDIMKWFVDNEYIIDYDQKQFTGNKGQRSKLNVEKFYPKNYGQIFDFEVDHIRDELHGSKKITSSEVLIVLAYIRLKTWRRVTNTAGIEDRKNLKKKKPEIFYTYINRMANELNMTEYKVRSILEWLSKAGIIKFTQLPSNVVDKDRKKYFNKGLTIIVDMYRFKNIWQRSVNDNTYNPDKELNLGRQYLMSSRINEKKYTDKQKGRTPDE